MTKKQVALFAAVMLAMVIIGDSRPERSIHAQAARPSSGSASQPQSAPANAATWEYKILYDTRIAALETAINQLSEQGYIVDSFQTISSRSALPSFVPSIVLLKRIRK